MLTSAQKTAYERDGVLFPLAALRDAETARYRARVEEALALDPENHKLPHLKFDWALELATHPAVVAAAESVLGKTAIWGAMVLRKEPHSRSFVSWHQDGAYREFGPGDCVTAWIALADSVPRNGCMQVVRGSHHTRLPHHDQPEPDNMIRLGKHVECSIDGAAVTDVVLRAGEMSLHHNDIIHGSQPNTSDQPRIGFIVRFMKLGLPWSEFPLVVPGELPAA
ncbi:MAG TPA: phytanoyl-CoA dioxygenase family protein [Thermoanaerobaculia bacterium]|nr:phytanoyl-CoA dioxygenase family protein [Thermoanaerobaculia bacterium]